MSITKMCKVLVDDCILEPIITEGMKKYPLSYKAKDNGVLLEPTFYGMISTVYKKATAQDQAKWNQASIKKFPLKALEEQRKRTFEHRNDAFNAENAILDAEMSGLQQCFTTSSSNSADRDNATINMY